MCRLASSAVCRLPPAACRLSSPHAFCRLPSVYLRQVDLLLLRKMSLLEACHGSNRSVSGADGPLGSGRVIHTQVQH